jgi:hypothetical protein
MATIELKGIPSVDPLPELSVIEQITGTPVRQPPSRIPALALKFERPRTPMLVEQTSHFKTRKLTGLLVGVMLDGPEPEKGSRVRCLRNGAEFVVDGVEWFAIPRRPTTGDRVSLLLPLGADVRVGDEIERVA